MIIHVIQQPPEFHSQISQISQDPRLFKQVLAGRCSIEEIRVDIFAKAVQLPGSMVWPWGELGAGYGNRTQLCKAGHEFKQTYVIL